MANGFTTSLNGSGVIVAVADSGLDADHSDFGARVLSNTDVVGDGSTADGHWDRHTRGVHRVATAAVAVMPRSPRKLN